MKTTFVEWFKATELYLTNHEALTLYYIYTDSRRHYHNVDHIMFGLPIIQNFAGIFSRDAIKILSYAWLGHDLVYIPGDQKNESLSFEYLNNTVLEEHSDLATYHINFIKECILATTHKNIGRTSPSSENLVNVITDIDLLGFALGYDQYEKIFAEYKAFNPNLIFNDFRIGRRNWLINFLKERDNVIYKTCYFNQLNPLALHNIRSSINNLESIS